MKFKKGDIVDVVPYGRGKVMGESKSSYLVDFWPSYRGGFSAFSTTGNGGVDSGVWVPEDMMPSLTDNQIIDRLLEKYS